MYLRLKECIGFTIFAVLTSDLFDFSSERRLVMSLEGYVLDTSICQMPIQLKY